MGGPAPSPVQEKGHKKNEVLPPTPMTGSERDLQCGEHSEMKVSPLTAQPRAATGGGGNCSFT